MTPKQPIKWPADGAPLDAAMLIPLIVDPELFVARDAVFQATMEKAPESVILQLSEPVARELKEAASQGKASVKAVLAKIYALPEMAPLIEVARAHCRAATIDNPAWPPNWAIHQQFLERLMGGLAGGKYRAEGRRRPTTKRTKIDAAWPYLRIGPHATLVEPDGKVCQYDVRIWLVEAEVEVCDRWCDDIIAANPGGRPMSKRELWAEFCNERGDIAERTFDTKLTLALERAPAESRKAWTRPGPSKRSQRRSPHLIASTVKPLPHKQKDRSTKK
jgi:hypothetical protein